MLEFMEVFPMYKNIGKKIKGLAMWLCIFEAVISIIYGIVIIVEVGGGGALLGLALLLLGPVISWISSWMLYGFGELIDKASSIERNTRKEENAPESQPKIVSPDFGKSTINRNY
jgi:hypothetical protein